jgi:transposase-like protein
MNTKVEAGKPLTTKPSMTLAQVRERFKTEDDCKAFIRASRWANGVRCPRCGNEKLTELKTRPWHWQCRQCGKAGYRFSVITGTVFENTKYPLRTWFEVGYLMCQSKKGISALQIHRQIGSGDYRTAWYICHRLRAAMKNEEFKRLTGKVEIDETYIGGKNANRPLSKRFELKGRGAVGKTTVIGAISRKGNVVCKVIENTSAQTMTRFVRQTVDSKVDLVATDEGAGYKKLAPEFPHQTVDHKALEYVRGEVHTNNIESFWSLLKRGVIGTFHNVSKDYLPLYLNEFAFRHNERENPDIFEKLISSC